MPGFVLRHPGSAVGLGKGAHDSRARRPFLHEAVADQSGRIHIAFRGPEGMDQAASSFFAQKGPPIWTKKTRAACRDRAGCPRSRQPSVDQRQKHIGMARRSIGAPAGQVLAFKSRPRVLSNSALRRSLQPLAVEHHTARLGAVAAYDKGITPAAGTRHGDRRKPIGGAAGSLERGPFAARKAEAKWFWHE
jgi:hypothetical protein